MAIQKALVSIQVLDDDGTARAFDQPIQFDDAVATLATLKTWVQGLGTSLDTVTDGQVTKIRLCILYALPGGIKAVPNAKSILERTGLISFTAANTPNTFGVDVPAILPTLATGDTLPNVGALLAFENYLTTVATGIVATDRYGNVLTARKSARKTFRKDN